MPWRRGDINGRSHRHAASHFRHVLSLHDEAHLEPLNPQFVLSRRVAFDLVVEAGGDDPCAHGQFASLDLFQAAAPEQACHLVALLVLPNRRQSLVVHRCAVVLRVGLSQVYPRKIMECLARLFLRSLPKLCTGVQEACFSELVPLRSPDSDPSSSEQRSCAAGEMFEPARDSACVLSICQSQEQSLNFGSQSLILRH